MFRLQLRVGSKSKRYSKSYSRRGAPETTPKNPPKKSMCSMWIRHWIRHWTTGAAVEWHHAGRLLEVMLPPSPTQVLTGVRIISTKNGQGW